MADVIVGIDFGSSGSGFSYAFSDNKDEIIHGMIYGANVDNKVPTEIILDDNNNTIRFGVECKNYMKTMGLEIGNYFKEIKMSLYEKKTEIQAKNSSKLFPLKLVIQRVLEKLKDIAIEEIKKHRPLVQDNIKYVVTVPAIWEEFQKNIMMEACINAGLIREEDDKSLFFALEPEAASYYCLNDKSIDQNLMKVGDYYIICDLGGGTGDIVTHLIGVNKNINEICPPNGGKLGSNEINKLFFEDIIYKIFECKDFNTYYKKYMELNKRVEDEGILYNDWNELEREVMDFKESTNIQNVCENEIYPINFGIFQDIYKKDIDINILVDKYNKNCDNNDLKIKIRSQKRWVIGFPRKIIYNYIKKQVDSICQIINNIIKHNDGINSMILVGGYCSNDVLISEIKKQLINKISYFLQPSKPCLSIMDGAVLFGLNPNKIVQRKARYTIGVGINKKWNEELHSKKGQKFYDKVDKIWRCKDCFDIFIKINQTIELGQEIIKEYHFNQPNFCEINIYKTLNSNSIFINDEGIEKIGELRLDAGRDYPPGERDNTITMRIGGTFIDVKAKHLKSGNSIKTKLLFN